MVRLQPLFMIFYLPMSLCLRSSSRALPKVPTSHPVSKGEQAFAVRGPPAVELTAWRISGKLTRYLPLNVLLKIHFYCMSLS